MKELRKLMRIQALRCNVVYCQKGLRLNVICVLASRSQALRYLLVRCSIDLSNMVVFVGESGDTDYEGLLGGIHKTVILKGIASDLHELHGNRSYPMEDVIPLNSPNIIEAEECGPDAIKMALEKLGINLLKP
ncbi:putative sucrose-phosphate synthase 2 [Cardamine amara subsp. amara]|uniref:Sucrose-phosphate synthase 2 n=1 Tax=Cardamine amara subsp. amara TaxID=228776 RepID=A0ABD1BRI2_CARAN